MTWVRLEDGFPEHPKVIKAGPAAAWLFVCGLAYANRNLTDGFIPAAVVPRLAELKGPGQLARKLVDAGLWERSEGGFEIHDYLAYQPSSARLKEERERTSARVDAWRKRRGNAVTEPSSNEASNGVTEPLVTVLVTPPPTQTRPGPVPEDVNLERGLTSWNGSAPSAAATTTAESLEKVSRFAEALRGRTGWEPTAEQLCTLGDYAAEHGINLAAEAIAIGGWLDGPKGRGRECSARFVLDWLKREARAPNGSAVPVPTTNGATPKARGSSRAKHH